MGVVDPRSGSGEIGYWAHPEARGRGVVTAAVDLVVRHAFTPIDSGGLGLHRLILTAAVAASQQVALANGFRRAGAWREAGVRRDGSREDLLLFDRLATDAAPFPSPPGRPTD
ncbi:MAG TPA: GNAT family protein [Kribbella sp.]|nr:GNAT family protein [Kribbella sp.]